MSYPHTLLLPGYAMGTRLVMLPLEQTISASGTVIQNNTRGQTALTVAGDSALACDTIAAGAHGQYLLLRTKAFTGTYGSIHLNPGGNIQLLGQRPWVANSVNRWIAFVYSTDTNAWEEVGRDYVASRPPRRCASYVADENLVQIQVCDNIANFTSTNGTRSLDTTNVLCGNGSIRLTPNNASSSVVLSGNFIGQPINVGANGFVEVRFKLLSGSGLADPNTYLSYINFAMLDSANEGNKRRIWSSGQWPDGTGWWTVRLPYSAINTVVGTPGDGMTTTALKQFYFEFIMTQASATCEMVLDRIAFVSSSPLASGYYCIRVDSTETWGKLLCDYAASKGVRVTLCVDPKLVGKGSYLTRQNLQDIRSMGHEIGLYHGDYPNVVWNLKTEYQKEGMIEFSRWFADDFGMDEINASIVHIPGGTGWQPSDSAKFGSRYAMATGNFRGESTYGLLNAPWTPEYMNWTYFIDGASVTKNANFGTWVTQAETEKSILMLGSHANDLAERNVFASCVDDLVASSSLKCCTFSDIVAGKIG